MCKLGVLLGGRGKEWERREGERKGFTLLTSPYADGGGVAHVDVVFGGGVRHAASDGRGTPGFGGG